MKSGERSSHTGEHALIQLPQPDAVSTQPFPEAPSEPSHLTQPDPTKPGPTQPGYFSHFFPKISENRSLFLRGED